MKLMLSSSKAHILLGLCLVSLTGCTGTPPAPQATKGPDYKPVLDKIQKAREAAPCVVLQSFPAGVKTPRLKAIWSKGSFYAELANGDKVVKTGDTVLYSTPSAPSVIQFDPHGPLLRTARTMLAIGDAGVPGFDFTKPKIAAVSQPHAENGRNVYDITEQPTQYRQLVLTADAETNLPLTLKFQRNVSGSWVDSESETFDYPKTVPSDTFSLPGKKIAFVDLVQEQSGSLSPKPGAPSLISNGQPVTVLNAEMNSQGLLFLTLSGKIAGLDEIKDQHGDVYVNIYDQPAPVIASVKQRESGPPKPGQAAFRGGPPPVVKGVRQQIYAPLQTHPDQWPLQFTITSLEISGAGGKDTISKSLSFAVAAPSSDVGSKDALLFDLPDPNNLKRMALGALASYYCGAGDYNRVQHFEQYLTHSHVTSTPQMPEAATLQKGLTLNTEYIKSLENDHTDDFDSVNGKLAEAYQLNADVMSHLKRKDDALQQVALAESYGAE